MQRIQAIWKWAHVIFLIDIACLVLRHQLYSLPDDINSEAQEKTPPNAQHVALPLSTI